MTAYTSTSDLVPYAEALAEFDPVLGLETHVELGTVSKMFCSCPTEFGAEPNTQVCPTCLGLPGSLPVVNEAAVRYTVMIGLALNCSIAPWCRFARKNYFYPDMPKDYQISQYDEPICVDGWFDVEVDGDDGPEIFRIPIERVHMEEDTGKSLHVGGSTGRIHGADYSLVDYNRAGIPLVEIVTKTIEGTGERAAEVAKAYVTQLADLLRGLGVSDVRMEQGSLRCDVNVSLMPKGSKQLGTRTETKNVNSFRSVDRAVRHEVERHAAILRGGAKIYQETRHFHEDSGTTSTGRSKEEATDYRYFPEPDLVPIALDEAYIAKVRSELPESPSIVRARLAEQYGWSSLEVEQMLGSGVLELVTQTVEVGAGAAEARNWWMNEVNSRANDAGLTPGALGVTPSQIARIIELVAAGELSAAMARQVLDGVVAGEGEPDVVVERRGLKRVSDTGALQAAVDAALSADPEVVERIKGGKIQAVGALVGSVMKSTKGQADAGIVRALILTTLGVSED